MNTNCAFFAVSTLSLLASACSGRQSETNSPWDADSTSVSPPPSPREKAPTKQKVRSPDGEWTATVKSVAPPTLEANGDQLTMSALLNSKEGFECSVAPELLEVGGTLIQVLQAIQEPYKLQNASVYAFDQSETNPLVFLRAEVVSTKAPSKTETIFAMVGVRDRNSINCVSDTIRDAKVFQKATKDFFTSFRWKQNPTPSLRSELWSMTSREKFIGFTQVGLYSGNEGRKLSGMTTVEFHEVDGNLVSIRDTNISYLLEKDEAIVQGMFAVSENGTDAFQATLEKNGKSYDVRGNDHGTPFEAKLKSAEPLAHDLAVRQLFRNLAQKKAPKKLTRDEYLPWFSRDKLTKNSFSFAPVGSTFELKSSASSGSITYQGTSDGHVTSIVVQSGPATVNVALVAETGTFFPEP